VRTGDELESLSGPNGIAAMESNWRTKLTTTQSKQSRMPGSASKATARPPLPHESVMSRVGHLMHPYGRRIV
jgi:hypothetical protein